MTLLTISKLLKGYNMYFKKFLTLSIVYIMSCVLTFTSASQLLFKVDLICPRSPLPILLPNCYACVI